MVYYWTLPLPLTVMLVGDKNWRASSKGWAESAPLVGIGLTDLPNIGPPAPPPHSSITEL